MIVVIMLLMLIYSDLFGVRLSLVTLRLNNEIPDGEKRLLACDLPNLFV